MHDYQQKRILGFIDCGIAPTKECWHTQQSIYAVGSGKIWGKGFLEGTQNQFNFVPEHWTDFPYSVWAEQRCFWSSASSLLRGIAPTSWLTTLPPLKISSVGIDRMPYCCGVIW